MLGGVPSKKKKIVFTDQRASTSAEPKRPTSNGGFHRCRWVGFLSHGTYGPWIDCSSPDTVRAPSVASLPLPFNRSLLDSKHERIKWSYQCLILCLISFPFQAAIWKKELIRQENLWMRYDQDHKPSLCQVTINNGVSVKPLKVRKRCNSALSPEFRAIFSCL